MVSWNGAKIVATAVFPGQACGVFASRDATQPHLQLAASPEMSAESLVIIGR